MQGGRCIHDRRRRHVPLGIDPNDSNIRIAPSFPPVEDVEKAITVFCTCVRMAALEKLGV